MHILINILLFTIKRLYIFAPSLIIWLSTPNFSFSQISISTGYGIIDPNVRGFGLFAETYNRYHKNELKSEYDNFKFGNLWFIGGAYLLNESTSLEASYSKAKSKNEANFINGDHRYYNLYINLIELSFGKGYNINKLGIWGSFGGIIGNISINSYYKYADGTYDFGLSKLLNGNYKGFYKGVSFAAKPIYYFNDNISFYIKVSGIHYFKPKPVEDEDASKLSTYPKSNNIPTDYNHFIEIYNSKGELPEQYKVKTDLRGFIYLIGIQYTFNE